MKDETVEVVARLMTWRGDSRSDLHEWSPCARSYKELPANRYPDGPWAEGEPLMTVAQHQRIVAAKDAEIAQLRVDNEALASNLRGKHATTGATYAHLVAERDELRAQLAAKSGPCVLTQAQMRRLYDNTDETQREGLSFAAFSRLFRYAETVYRVGEIAAQQAAVPVGWNLAADQLPGSGRAVLAFYLNSHGMVRRIRAEHIARWTVQAEGLDADPDTECVEYSEQDDAYYILEGWYELIDNWDDYSRIAVTEGVVTHWMDMPAAPAAPQQDEELWAVHAQGPDDLYAAASKEEAERHAAELNALPAPAGFSVAAVVIPSPWPAVEHWKYLSEQNAQYAAELLARLNADLSAQGEKP